jgi:hypothetical protein
VGFFGVGVLRMGNKHAWRGNICLLGRQVGKGAFGTIPVFLNENEACARLLLLG